MKIESKLSVRKLDLNLSRIRYSTIGDRTNYDSKRSHQSINNLPWWGENPAQNKKNY